MIRAGLIGFGLGGRVFHAPLLSSVDGIELAAILERTTNKAAARYPEITTFRTLDAMLADESLGLIVVTSPSATHYEIAKKVIAAGKNLVVDKPVCAQAGEIAELMKLAKEKNVILAPFHNRHWDGDFLTIRKLLAEGALGRLVAFDSTLDRFKPGERKDRLWKEDPAQAGGVLLDLGTHLAYQALTLFGKPERVGGEVGHERGLQAADDAFTVRMHYPRMTVMLGTTCLGSLERPRFHLRGTKGCYWKWHNDEQEAELEKVTRIASEHWGEEPSANWGTLSVERDGKAVTEIVTAIPGDYRQFYEGMRDALLGMAAPPTSPLDAWRVARIMEWVVESSEQHRDVLCDWSGEPEWP